MLTKLVYRHSDQHPMMPGPGSDRCAPARFRFRPGSGSGSGSDPAPDSAPDNGLNSSN